MKHRGSATRSGIATPAGSTSFAACRSTKPPQQRWKVRRDGGDFDAFTGATITPRAIVKAVRLTLEFYQGNEDRLYQDGPPR